MSETARLALPMLAAAQAQKHVTVNEALARLDALVQARAASRFLADPPSGSEDGDCWIVADGATGAWTGMAGRIAQRFAGGWTFHLPEDGWIAYVADEARMVVRTAGGWRDFTDAAVYYPAGDGVQLKLNKPAPADTASVMLQTGFSGRAEIGLVGDDDLAVKVSPDGQTWIEAMRVDRDNGRASFPAGAVRTETMLFEASGTWAKPAWVRFIIAVAIGGGGGGGSGRSYPPTWDRRGGGGGGGGGYAHMMFAAAELPDVIDIDVGHAGIAGDGIFADSTDGIAGTNGGHSALRQGSEFFVYAGGGGGGGGAKTGSTLIGPGGSGSHLGSNGGTGSAPTGYAATVPGIFHGPGGGGGAGGLPNNNNPGMGGAGAPGCLAAGPGPRSSPGGAAGALYSDGGHGANKGWMRGAGGGGGGGGAGDAAGTLGGGRGGDGGTPGGGGGGGGASANGAPTGGGGHGGRGEVVIIAVG
jgi:hypothetical protein